LAPIISADFLLFLSIACWEGAAMERQWVEETINRIAAFSSGQNGITRLAFSAEDLAAREYVMQLMRDMGLTVRVDAAGNIIGRLAGLDNSLPAVVTGSHIDSVPEGGKYDGVIGVIGGLLAIKRLQARGPLSHPLEIIVFNCEESSRFGISTMGSKLMAGVANLDTFAKATDSNGITFKDALASIGFKWENVKAAARPKEDFKAFIELHIEQGPVLEASKNSIGIVEAIAAPTRLKIVVEGVPAHSGTTPMNQRQDALVSAAMIVLAVQEVALSQSHYGTVGTVGVLKVSPGVMNVIPGLVEMLVDLRGTNYDSIIQSLQDIKDAISTISEGQETPVAIDVLTSEQPVTLDPNIAQVIEDSCRSLGLKYQRMPSGAGHDAMNMAKLTPTGMIFIPCHKGISHNPAEFASIDDIMRGIDVLTETLYRLAK